MDERWTREAIACVVDARRHDPSFDASRLSAEVVQSSEPGLCVLVVVRDETGSIHARLAIDFDQGVFDSLWDGESTERGFARIAEERVSNVRHRLRAYRRARDT
ncbi:MAG: hypothetical protein H6722_11795 [Sandaracinus sp.]|nr:hypothetical protein [Sandaracinus sp.]MCB9613127.1 hypothetical protein [Sandaracinus sp.]